ncbi:MAG: SCO family protein, partial [Holophagales bacterium]|nr:SCO family protein [Holophagales bacterium]
MEPKREARPRAARPWPGGIPERLAAVAALCLLLLGSPSALLAQPSQVLVEPEKMPGPLKEVRVDQKLGNQLPLDAELVDEHGKAVKLGDFFGERPVILAFVYYECPMLCSLILNGLASSLGVLSFTPGEEFDVVAISIDPRETPEMAAAAEASTLTRYGKPETEAGWHFLIGDEATVGRIAEVAGFGYEYLPTTDEYAHASAIMVTTPEGVLSQYFYGIEYPPKDVRLALVEASSNQIGSLVDQILLYCYRYDPEVGRYTAVAMRILRLTGAV